MEEVFSRLHRTKCVTGTEFINRKDEEQRVPWSNTERKGGRNVTKLLVVDVAIGVIVLALSFYLFQKSGVSFKGDYWLCLGINFFYCLQF